MMAWESGWSAPPPAPWTMRAMSMKARVGAEPQAKLADGEDGDAGHEEAFAAEFEGEPVAGGKDDGVGDQVAGEHPGGLVGGGGEGAGDVREGDRGDGGVQHLHEGGEHDGRGDEPGIDAGAAFGGEVGRSCGGGGHARRETPWFRGCDAWVGCCCRISEAATLRAKCGDLFPFDCAQGRNDKSNCRMTGSYRVEKLVPLQGYRGAGRAWGCILPEGVNRWSRVQARRGRFCG